MQEWLEFEDDRPEFLAHAGIMQRILHFRPDEILFHQGEPARRIFYLQKGRAKVTVRSPTGKEATILLVSAGDFIGEEVITPLPRMSLGTATSITACTVWAIERTHLQEAIHADSNRFCETLLEFLATRNMRVQSDLVDVLCSSSEKRLARTLLLMADLIDAEESVALLPMITQETLAEIVGTTRSRVNVFMNRFRRHGLIDYNRRIRVHKLRLRRILED